MNDGTKKDELNESKMLFCFYKACFLNRKIGFQASNVVW